jgi:hypothetical protein
MPAGRRIEIENVLQPGKTPSLASVVRGLKMWRPVALALLLLAGCGADPPEAPATTAQPASVPSPAPAPAPAQPPRDAAQTPGLAVEGEGLRLFNRTTGAATPIAFGRPQDEVLRVLEQLLGPAEHGENAECGAGPVQFATWPDGLSLTFQNQQFAGWGLGRRTAGRHSTAAGIGPGSTRQAMEAVYADVSVMQSSLGEEFSAGGFFGVLDGPGQNAKITDMWAGVACIAR